MAMLLAVPTYTVDDLDRFPADGNRYQLLAGMLLVSPSPSLSHQVVTQRVAAALSEQLRPWPQFLVTSPGVIIVQPPTRLVPDILVCRAPNQDFQWEDVREHFLAVETKSRSTEVYDRDFKRPAYLELGVPEVWRVDVAGRVVLVTRRGEAEEVPVGDRLVWRPRGLVEAVTLEVPPLFQGLE